MSEPSLPTIFGFLTTLIEDASVPLAGGTALISSGLLDSLKVLELVEWLEEEFSIRALAKDVGEDTLDTPARILAYVQRRRAE